MRLNVWLVALSLAAANTNGFQFDLKLSDSRCFDEEIIEDTLVAGTFAVQPVEAAHLRLEFMDREGDVVFKKEEAENGKYSFTATKSGLFQFCFYSSFEGFNPDEEATRRVTFTISEGASAVDYQQLAKAESLRPLEKELRKGVNLVRDILGELKHMKHSESKHRATNDGTNFNVPLYSFLSVVIVVGAGLLQVYYLKQFFRERKML